MKRGKKRQRVTEKGKMWDNELRQRVRKELHVIKGKTTVNRKCLRLT